MDPDTRGSVQIVQVVRGSRLLRELGYRDKDQERKHLRFRR